MNMKSTTLALCVLAFALVGLPAAAQHDATTKHERVKFDPKRDPEKDLQAAIKTATAHNMRILLDVGGEWCIWCRRMDEYFIAQKDLGELLHRNFVVVKVNFSPENENKAFLSKYPKINGYPHIFVLEKDGKLLHSQDTGLLEEGPSYSRDKVLAFLTKWARPRK